MDRGAGRFLFDVIDGSERWGGAAAVAAALELGGRLRQQADRNRWGNQPAMDLFVVPTIAFDLLYAIVIVRLARRELFWINVTANPTAEWVARQITEAFPWDDAPRYLIRDRV